MKLNLLIFLVCIGIISCNRPAKVEREGEPDIYSLADEGDEMNAAIAHGVATLDTFKIALLSGNDNFFSFTLKKRFDTSWGEWKKDNFEGQGNIIMSLTTFISDDTKNMRSMALVAIPLPMERSTRENGDMTC